MIPDAADDAMSLKRNMEKLKEESCKQNLNKDAVKSLMICTFPVRRAEMLDSNTSVSGIVDDLPVLKKCCYDVRIYDYNDNYVAS